MNYSTLALTVGDNVKAVGVKFYSEQFGDDVAVRGKTYTYKTTVDLEVGDLAAVFVGKRPKIVQVVKLNPLVSQNETIEYRWIVCKVEVADYLTNLEEEGKLIEDIQRIEATHQRQQVLEALGAVDAVKQITFK